MKRPMCMLAVTWLAGLFLAGQWPELETNYVLLSYFFLIILGLIVLKKYPQYLNSRVQSEWYPQLTVLLLLLPCMFLLGHFRMEQTLFMKEQKESPWRQAEESGESYVLVQGIVKEKRCEEQIELILTDCVLVGNYGQENKSAGNCRIMLDEEGKEWSPETFIGNEIQVYGKFSTYRKAGNPGQFDAYEYYTGKDLYASVKALRVTVLDDGKNELRQSMFILKQRLRESLTALYPKEKAGVLSAMMLGEKDLLADEVEMLYRQNGISHILAISGLHISMLCMGLFHFLKKVGVPLKVSMLMASIFLCFYVVFTGASISSLRAGVMCLVLFGAKLFRRSYDLLSSLSLAAIVVTAIRPTELTSAGFLLSFGAVLGVALAQEVERQIQEEGKGQAAWWGALLFGGMIQCVTIPISLSFFYEMSPYSIFLNLVVIPLVSLILGGGLLSVVLGLFVPGVAGFFVGGTYLLLEFYEWLGGMVQKLPFSFVLVGQPENWQLVVYYGLLLGSVKLFFTLADREHADKKQSRVHKAVGLAAGMLCSIGVLFLPGSHNAGLLFLDVSQGDGALITTADGRVILSDCGSSDVSKVGEYRLSPVLKQKGTLLVDMAVVSHLDADHTSGIKELLEAMPVYEGKTSYAAGYKGTVGIAELVLPVVKEKSEAYAALEALALQKQVNVRYVQAGEVLYQEDDLLIECLSPENARKSENDTSLVLLLQTPKLVAWLMGDAETGSEEKIMERLLGIDMETLYEGKTVVLKVGHHGSKTSSGAEFIDLVAPDIAVISCGYQNTYGHPHAEVLQRLETAGCEVFRTDLQGAITVETDYRDEIIVQSRVESQ